MDWKKMGESAVEKWNRSSRQYEKNIRSKMKMKLRGMSDREIENALGNCKDFARDLVEDEARKRGII